MGNETEAIDCFLQANRIDPSYTEAMYILGNILVDAGRPSTAITTLIRSSIKILDLPLPEYAKGKALKLMMNQGSKYLFCAGRQDAVSK